MHNEDSAPDLNTQYQQLRENLTRDFDKEVSRLEDKITAQNSNISEAAIKKVMTMVYVMVGFLTAMTVVFTVFGYQNIKDGMTEMVRAKVNGWLSYEEQKSPINETFLSIRDRYLLDSVYVRYQRSRTEHRYDFKITDKELTDLVRIANDRDTSLKDYSDILNLYSSSFVLGSIQFRGNYQANIFGDIFSKDGFKEQYMKQREFLTTFSHDYSVFPIAKEILESKRDYLIFEAFDVALNTNPEYAVEYAKKHLTGDSFERLDRKMALALAKYDTESKQFIQYKDRLFEVRGELEGWLFQYFDIFTSLIRPKSKIFAYELQDKHSDAVRSKMALEMLITLINDGYGITISERFGKRIELSKLGGSSVGVSRYEAEKIYDNPAMLNQLVQHNANSPEWIAKLSSALEVFHDDEYLVTVMAELNDASQVTLSDGSTLTKKDVLGSIWFTVDKSSNNALEIAYRDTSGELRRQDVSVLSNMQKSVFSYRFNEHDLYSFAENKNLYLD